MNEEKYKYVCIATQNNEGRFAGIVRTQTTLKGRKLRKMLRDKAKTHNLKLLGKPFGYIKERRGMKS